jgi:hypothetical protein
MSTSGVAIQQTNNSKPPNRAKALLAKRTAMLIIHGIGEQNPYETLDRFARGVYTHVTTNRGANATLRPIQIAHKDWTQVGMRISTSNDAAAVPQGNPDPSPSLLKVQEEEPYVDVFEYYWAPETEDKLSAVQTLKWTLQTSFSPIHHIADNLQEIMGANPTKRLTFSIGRALWLYFVEFRRIVFVFIPLATALAGFLYWLHEGESRAKALRDLGADLFAGLRHTFQSSPLQLIAGLLYIAGLLIVWFLLQFIQEWHDYPAESVEDLGDRLWIVVSGVMMIILFCVGRVLEKHSHATILVHVGEFVSHHRLLLIEATLAYLTTYALTAYAADVAVYVNADAKSKSYVARNAILKGSTDALKALLKKECGYDRVILAGHSLGSVIAYDSINDLLAEVNSAQGLPSDRPAVKLTKAELQKLKGLVTFGSPLDKIYYFFREQVKRDQALRAQILSMLHSFRRCPSGREYGKFQFKYSFRQLDDVNPPIRWLNAWARMDPVSSTLRFYQPDKNRCFCYTIPVWSHTKYWSDPDFFDYFCDELL